MNDYSMVKSIDDLGRVHLPKELRRALELREGDQVEVWRHGSTICIEKLVTDLKCVANLQAYADSLSELIGYEVAISDNFEIHVGTGVTKHCVVGEMLNSKYMSNLKFRECFHQPEGHVMVGIPESNATFCVLGIAPIYDIENKTIGYIWVLGKDELDNAQSIICKEIVVNYANLLSKLCQKGKHL